MRLKSIAQKYFNFSKPSSLKFTNEFRAKYEAISRILDANTALLAAAHADWSARLSQSRQGRGGFTSEQILRALLVMFIEGLGYRDTILRIDESDFLNYFVRLNGQPVMNHTFLCRALCALTPATLERMNALLAGQAREAELISGTKQRMDSTAYEANIHYPTDSSLLWDSFRVLARWLHRVRKCQPELKLTYRLHSRRAKKLAVWIARNGASKSKKTQRTVKSCYRELIRTVERIQTLAQSVQGLAGLDGQVRFELKRYLPLVARVIDQARRRVLEGETVPADEKLYSLFESHTRLLIRGKAGKAVEFGHKLLLCQTGEKFIHHYQVMDETIDDTELLEPALTAHQKLFGEMPEMLCADKGFYRGMEEIRKLEKDIKTVSIAKKGKRTPAEQERETTDEFKEGQRFRAGSEGSISVLKRAFKLGKCLFKGFKNCAASVGLAVLCHNLVLLTRL